jgi:hypothetical protein
MWKRKYTGKEKLEFSEALVISSNSPEKVDLISEKEEVLLVNDTIIFDSKIWFN